MFANAVLEVTCPTKGLCAQIFFSKKRQKKTQKNKQKNYVEWHPIFKRWGTVEVNKVIYMTSTKEIVTIFFQSTLGPLRLSSLQLEQVFKKQDHPMCLTLPDVLLTFFARIPGTQLLAVLSCGLQFTPDAATQAWVVLLSSTRN